jgi:hypothetical protein
MQQSHTFASPTSQHTSQSLQKSVPAQTHRQSITADRQTTTERRAACNTGLAKVAVQCSADTFVVNQSLVLRINICGENRHLRQARNRYAKPYGDSATINLTTKN